MSPAPCRQEDNSPRQALLLAWEALEPPGGDAMTEQIHSIAAVRVGRGAGRENRQENTFGPGPTQLQPPIQFHLQTS